MKVLLSIFTFLLWSINATQTDFVFADKEVTAFSNDQMGNLYVVDNNNVIYKLNANGKIIEQQNIKTLGNVSKVDASNPFEIYIYYQDQGVLAFIDNQLAERGSVSLVNDFTNLPSSVARSYNNGIWLFDPDRQTLKQCDKNLKVLNESTNLNLTFSQGLTPNEIFELNKNVIVVDSANGVFIFDLFGNFKKKWAFKNVKSVESRGKDYLLLTNQYVLNYQPTLFKTDTLFEFPKGRFSQFQLEPPPSKSILLLSNEGKIERFKW
jgi:hypothetical protein